MKRQKYPQVYLMQFLCTQLIPIDPRTKNKIVFPPFCAPGQIIWRGFRSWEGSNSHAHSLVYTLAVADWDCCREKIESDGDRSSSESQKLVVLLQRSRFCSHHSPLSLCSPTWSQARGFRVLRHRSPPRSIFFISHRILFLPIREICFRFPLCSCLEFR